MPPFTEADAAREILKRRRARESLIGFTKFTYPKYEAADVHRKIAAQLERVEKGEVDRLMLLVAPRHGKSELASRRFPAWFLGRHPDKHFIAASAAGSLAEDAGREVRNIISSQEYRALFDTRLAEDSQARGKWNTAQGGAFYATGVGAAIMGRGAHVFLIDDPFGSMADARSEAEQRNVWNWYTGTAYNRLEEKGAVIVINHRTSERDLSGMLLEQQAAGGDQWTVVELKPDMERGIALWPERYPIETLERIRRNTTAQDWSALYLQNPVPDEGTFFLSEWFKPYTSLARETMRFYIGSDFALTAGGGDWTAHIVVGVDPSWNIYVVDVWRRRAVSDESVEAFCDLVAKWKPLGAAQESGQIKAALGPYLMRRMRERQLYVPMATFPTRGDKEIRCQSIRARMALSGIYLPTSAPWLSDFKAELTAFPYGRHDDICDALGLIGQTLDKMRAGSKPKPVESGEIIGLTGLTLDKLFELSPKRRADDRI